MVRKRLDGGIARSGTRTAFAKAVGLAIVSVALLFSGGVGASLFSVQSALAATQTTITVKAVGLDGSIHHMWTVLKHNGNTVATGYTPVTFTGTAGQTYTVTVSNYNNIVFDHWDSGSTSSSRTVTLGTSDLTWTAYYQTGTTSPSASQTSITVKAVGLDGTKLHMWTDVKQNGQTLKTGYTPITFTGTAGQTYTVTVSNYNNIVFDHWDSGSTSSSRTVTLGTSDLTWTAYYQTGTTPPANQTVGTVTATVSSDLVMIGQNIGVFGTVYDTTSTPMANVGLDITMGTFSTTTTSSSTGTYSVSIPTTVAGTFAVNVKTGDGTVSAPPVSVTVSSTSPPPTSGKTGVYIPMYSYPTSSTLSSFLTIMQTDGPSLPYVVAINPNSGPGSSLDSTFTNAINTLHNSGLNVTVIGYVPTGYGTSRSVANVEGMIDTWYSLYPHIDGFMFDEVDNTQATDSFYKTITDYARSHGAHFIKGNPGAPIDAGKVGMFDMIAIGESGSYPSVSELQSDTFNGAYGKDKFAYVIYGQSTLNSTWLTSAESYLGCVYITNDVEPNPYDTIPSYFAQEVSALQTQ